MAGAGFPYFKFVRTKYPAQGSSGVGVIVNSQYRLSLLHDVVSCSKKELPAELTAPEVCAGKLLQRGYGENRGVQVECRTQWPKKQQKMQIVKSSWELFCSMMGSTVLPPPCFRLFPISPAADARNRHPRRDEVASRAGGRGVFVGNHAQNVINAVEPGARASPGLEVTPPPPRRFRKSRSVFEQASKFLSNARPRAL